MTEPMLVSGMRRRPTGDVRHTPEGGGADGTSTQGFLREYDRAIAKAERRGAVKALRRFRDRFDSFDDPHDNAIVAAIADEDADAIERGSL